MLTAETRDLTARLAALLRQERASLADFLLLLADFDRDQRWREPGYASLFDFLRRELGVSKGAAFYRMTAARLIQRVPEIVEPLRDGRLCFTSVVELAKVVTLENQAEVLPLFFHASKKEAQAIAAELAPHEAPPQRAVVTGLPAPSRPHALTARQGEPERSVPAAPQPATASVLTEAKSVHPDEPAGPERTTPAPELPPPTLRDEVVPLTAELRRLHATVSRRFLGKLEAARTSLSHSNPGASIMEVLEAGLDLLLARDAKKKGLVVKPRAVPPADADDTCGSDHISAAVRRAVWSRDEGRCQWSLEDGGICGSTFCVELDHVIPRARGGRSTVEGLRLLCKAHNLESARRILGDEVMDRYAPRRPMRAARQAGKARTARE